MAAGAPTAIEDPARWGLATETVEEVAERLRSVWGRSRACFMSKTRDTSEMAWTYLRGEVPRAGERTFTNIARRIDGRETDGQRVQHFISSSPWSAQSVLEQSVLEQSVLEQSVLEQVRAEVAASPVLQQGTVLILDESADVKSGVQTAGAGRHSNGRLGKVEVSQVGTFLALATEAARLWTWIDGEVFLPEHWLAPERAKLRQHLGIPPERQFATKIALGWQMIQRVRVAGRPFAAVLCDELYGRSRWLRAQLDAAGLLSVAEVPADTPIHQCT